ncbi:hypothetical protein V1524DRAFT_418112 [Lipomyces starkeyi]
MSLEIALHDREQVSYHRALNFLKVNEPEKRVDVHLWSKFFQLLDEQAQALYGDAKYMTLSYEDGSASGLQELISRFVHDTLIRLNKGELCDDILPVRDSQYSIVDDQGRTSRKTPDGGPQYLNDEGKNALTLIIEAGVSE